MCKVSVIIPVYNVEKYLRDCLDSVLNQTLRDVEIICIDDASPDRCSAILDEYAAQDARIQVVHLQENRRQGVGRNLGVERAKGEYLYFLDSDDTIDSETLEELSRLADRENLDAVFFDCKETYENEALRAIYTSSICLRNGVYRDEAYEGKELLDEFIRQHEWTCYPQRIFWRREFIVNEGIRYLEDCFHEDEFFAFAGILTAKRARYVRKQYFNRRVRPNSVMTSEPKPSNFRGYLMSFYYMNEFASERNLTTNGVKTILITMFERAMTLYAKLKDSYDIEDAFQREPDKTVYRYFKSYLWLEYGKDGFYSFDSETLEEIRKYRIAYVYGVGPTALRVCKKLERNDVLIGGFLFKGAENAPSVLMGRSVTELDEAVIPDDAIVVVATKVMFWEGIRDMLKSKNFRCVFHRRL